jgi:hypothetical protein
MRLSYRTAYTSFVNWAESSISLRVTTRVTAIMIYEQVERKASKIYTYAKMESKMYNMEKVG